MYISTNNIIYIYAYRAGNLDGLPFNIIYIYMHIYINIYIQ